MVDKPATDALYRALSSPEPEPQVVHAAIEEIRDLSGQNVITVIGAQITELRAEIGTQITELRAEMKAENAEIRARMDALGSRIDTLQKVIWPLIAILATSVFGLLYKAVTG